MSANVIKLLEYKAVSHLLATNVASEISVSDMLGNRNMLNLSPTPYRSSVLKSRLIRSPYTM